MGEVFARDRLLPCLLDRLCDPGTDESDTVSLAGVVSHAKYRRSVLRDLGWLLNTTAPAAWENFDSFPLARGSVLNFGISDMAGIVAAEIDNSTFVMELKEALASFEPRIDPISLEIGLDASEKTDGLRRFALTIDATLWSNPAPERQLIRYEIDFDARQIEMIEGG